jgi:glycosyltransferase involved in cell wall biosynthesis
MSQHIKDFSVITPVYNGGDLLRETLDSVLKYCDNYSYEYLVINDGSTDKTSEILDEYTDQINVVNTANQGEANAVNEGISRAKGKYCLVVSADDPLISADLFHEALAIFERNPSVTVAYPDWNMIDGNSTIISTVKTIEYSELALIGEFVCIPGPGAIFRLDLAKKIGGRNPELKFGSDYDFWLRLSQMGVFQRIPKVLAQWRSHSNSTSISSKGIEMARERIFVIENFLSLFPQTKSLTRSARAHAYYHASLLSYFSKDVPGAAWMFKAFVIRRGWIEKADPRIVIYCLLLPASRYILPFLLRIPMVRALLKRQNSY